MIDEEILKQEITSLMKTAKEVLHNIGEEKSNMDFERTGIQRGKILAYETVLFMIKEQK